MLGYALMFIVIGFVFGLFSTPSKEVHTLFILISTGWAFFHGFWGIAAYFELIIGQFLGAFLRYKMLRED